MDDMSAYYNPYYQQPPPPPPQYWHPPSSLAAAAPPPPQPPQYHHNPPPPSYASPYLQTAPPPPLPPSHQYYDDVRTLFIAGLPEDVEAREIYNLFREFPGYESSKLRRATEHNQPYGFAVFRDQHSAANAMQTLNGLVFDLEKQSTLYISLAKSNSKSKRSRTDDGRFDSSDKKFRGPAGFYDTGAGSNVHMHGLGNSAYNTIGYSSTQRHGFDRGPANGAESKGMNTPLPSVPQNSPACPTLFVANLGPNCAEMELIEVFSRYPGFLKLKMQNKNGAPVAFVDFQDVNCSTAALNNLQGTVLHTSSELGMTIEYAKSRMGKPKKGS